MRPHTIGRLRSGFAGCHTVERLGPQDAGCHAVRWLGAWDAGRHAIAKFGFRTLLSIHINSPMLVFESFFANRIVD